jgi:hypothetical protein
MATTETLRAQKWTVNAIKQAVRATGSHWFDPSTMRFFGTQILPTVYQGSGGIYFVTSEQPPHGRRAYTVRQFVPKTTDIKTIGDVSSMTRRAAMKNARTLAKGDGKCEVVSEAFKPVCILEQFIADLKKHGKDAAIVSINAGARELIQLACRHEKYMEGHCNGEWPYGRTWEGAEDGEHPKVVQHCRERIKILAEGCGAKGVILGGDPRGCTCKLVFHDGFTNDFAKEGYCVPTSEKETE